MVDTMDKPPPANAHAYSAASLAKRWDCTPHHIRRLCASGELKFFRLGSLIRISAEEVARIENPPAPATEPPRLKIEPIILGIR